MKKTYKASVGPVVSKYFRASKVKVLRDAPKGQESPVQTQYLNFLAGAFLRALAKVYCAESLTEADKAKLRKYLERLIEAKESLSEEEPKGGLYKRQ